MTRCAADAWHKRLVQYYSYFGFRRVRAVGDNGLRDLPDRLVWGGVGMRMVRCRLWCLLWCGSAQVSVHKVPAPASGVRGAAGGNYQAAHAVTVWAGRPRHLHTEANLRGVLGADLI